MIKTNSHTPTIITAGSTYLDIDAYACAVSLAELFKLCGREAIAYSNATYNYSICPFLIEKGQVLNELPDGLKREDVQYVIVDLSDPDYISESVPLEKVVELYDHHAGFEEYWKDRIGEESHIEFIGAAATLIYREWKKRGMQDKMSRTSALLLIAAILDNTLDLTASNTTKEDIDAFNELCQKENIDRAWCDSYFASVQKQVEADLENAIFGDIKMLRGNKILPPRIAQICVWDAKSVLGKLPLIRAWFERINESFMINIIDIKERCSYFICDDSAYQTKIEKVFDLEFTEGVARSGISYLRKQIIKKTLLLQSTEDF